MGPDLVLQINEPPRSALSRVAAAINKEPKRLFGVVKIHDEYVGVVSGDEFEVWERRRRAVHAVGQAERHDGGTRVTVRFPLARQTRLLLPLFFALYAVVAGGLAQRTADPLFALALAAAGAVGLAIMFVVSARRQRDQLRRFLEAVLTESAAAQRPP